MQVGVYYQNANAAIEWLVKAFGFEVQLKVDGPDGKVAHSELMIGDAMIYVGDQMEEKNRPWQKSPKEVGGANTQSICVFVDDADAHCAVARENGATIAVEPYTTDYGDDYWADRSYQAVDPDGHHWWFMTRLRSKA